MSPEYKEFDELRDYLKAKGFFTINTGDYVADYEETVKRYQKISDFSQNIYCAGLDKMAKISLEITNGNKEN